MTHYTQACTLGAILLLSAFVPGCAEDNQKEAARQSGASSGSVPKDNLTAQERRLQTGRVNVPPPPNYPGQSK
jgi:hypothetical protein